MSVTIGQGFAPSLLHHIKQIAMQSTPQYKMETPGFLNLLMSQAKPSEVKLNTESGHRKTVRIKAKQRATKDMTDTSKSCDNTLVPVWQEQTIDLSVTRQIAFHIPDETIARYEDDASRTVNIGQPATPIMGEFLENIMTHTSAMLEGINDDLLTLAVANVGVNRVTGSNASQTININKDGVINPLGDGFTKILTDYKRNGGTGRPQIVGAGLMLAWEMQNAQNSLSANQSGLNISNLKKWDFFYDEEMETAAGTNQIIAYEPNAVQLVEYMEYVGYKAGVKPGASTFGVLTLPAMVNGEIKPVQVDFQLKYNDCAQEFTDAYYGTTITLEKGFNLILSKQCGLFTIQDNAYRGTDVLNGNRGSYRFTIYNDCENCS